VGQTAYYVVVIILGLANVVLAMIAYGQRARQLTAGHLHRDQLSLAAERNRMAAQRVERLNEQVALLTAIRDSMAPTPLRRLAAVTPPRDCVGVIDIGSITVRLVVVRADANRARVKVIGDERAFLHLGAEVERTGGYSHSTMERVAARVAAFEHLAGSLGCRRLVIVLTAPGRRGNNPGDLTTAIERFSTGPVQSLSAEEEARLTFMGAACQSQNPDQRLIVCDVGGGSTEVAAGTRRAGVEQTCCIDLGAVSLAERHFCGESPSSAELAAALDAAEREVNRHPLPAGDVLVATGGSAHAVARLIGPVVDGDQLGRALELAARMPKRVAKRLPPQRRRSLPAGVALLSAIQARLDMPLTMSRGGLREGVIRQLLDDTWVRPQPLQPPEQMADVRAGRIGDWAS
jgi:exopolyphosphatase/guanosine-5'-triphosphate,3'-diphosphate pyrophosphatase